MKFAKLVSATLLAAFTGTSLSAATVDVVFVVDESGSMSGEHRFLEDVIPDLDSALAVAGITGLYSVVGYGSSSIVPRIVYDSVTASQAAFGADGVDGGGDDLADELLLNGGTEDGYAGMSFGLNKLTLGGDAINMILVTDEDRDDRVNCTLFGCISDGAPDPSDDYADSYAEMLAQLNSDNVVLNAIISQRLQDGAIGFNASGSGNESYLPDGSGGFTTQAGGGYISKNTLGFDYGDMALATNGAVWNLDILRSGGDNATSFASAFIDIKVQEIEEQIPPVDGVIPLPAAAWMLLAGIGSLGVMRRRQQRAAA